MIINCNKLFEILRTRDRKIVLAFDWGKTCTGVAVTDDKMRMILPCAPIVMNDAKNKKNFWSKLVENYNADAVVIGIPKHHEDKPNPTEDAVIAFANALDNELHDTGFYGENEIHIAFVNEAGTSKSAEFLQHDIIDFIGKANRKNRNSERLSDPESHINKPTRKKKRESLNSLSACLILERFIY